MHCMTNHSTIQPPCAARRAPVRFQGSPRLKLPGWSGGESQGGHNVLPGKQATNGDACASIYYKSNETWDRSPSPFATCRHRHALHTCRQQFSCLLCCCNCTPSKTVLCVLCDACAGAKLQGVCSAPREQGLDGGAPATGGISSATAAGTDAGASSSAAGATR